MNIAYIQTSMTAAFGGSSRIFGIIIQGNSTSSHTDSFIYATDNSASFSAGINMINPTWSYYVYFETQL